jgi:hypothetical protein
VRDAVADGPVLREQQVALQQTSGSFDDQGIFEESVELGIPIEPATPPPVATPPVLQ